MATLTLSKSVLTTFYTKGPGLIRGIFGLRFSEKVQFPVLFGLYSHHKAICHNYKIHLQISVLMYSVAMETSTILVKMLFFSIFHILLPFSELFINIEIPHHRRTNTKLLVYVKLQIILIYRKFCVGPWVVRCLLLHLKVQK